MGNSKNIALLVKEELVFGVKAGKYHVEFFTTNIDDEKCIFSGERISGPAFFADIEVDGSKMRVFFSQDYSRFLSLVQNGKMDFHDGKFVSLK